MTVNITHFGPDSFGGVAHKGTREGCSYPDCAWPREGDFVTAVSREGEFAITLPGDRERSGVLADFGGWEALVSTSSGKEYPVDPATIRRPDRGTYCPHGLKVMEEVPAEHTCEPPGPLCTEATTDPFHECPEAPPCPACFPASRIVEPWPCEEEGCTREVFERASQEEIDKYWASVNGLITDR